MLELSTGRVGSGRIGLDCHKIICLGWVGLGVKRSNKYTIYTRETDYSTNIIQLMIRSCEIAIYCCLLMYSDVKEVLFGLTNDYITIVFAPSVQQLLLVCEHELYSLDMAINVKKSSCIRIGPRFNVNCCNYYNRRLP